MIERRLEGSQALAFILAGNATFTLRSAKTGVRYTYNVRQSDDTEREPRWFVSYLVGSDNTSDYVYVGMITESDGLHRLRLTKKSRLNDESLPVVAFRWTIERQSRRLPVDGVEIWHAGRCGRCGRTLTVPESIDQGFGPECLGKARLRREVA